MRFLAEEAPGKTEEGKEADENDRFGVHSPECLCGGPQVGK